MARVSYDKQQAIKDMVYSTAEKIVDDDKICFAKTPDGKIYTKMKAKAKKLEDQAAALYRQAKMYLPPKTVDMYRRGGDIAVTQKAYDKIQKLEVMHRELATSMTFASNGKEYELIQEFIQKLKTL